MNWILETFFGTDWETMNWMIGEVCVNIPISVVLSVCVAAVWTVIQVVSSILVRKSYYKDGWRAGYECGMHSRLMKLARIKYTDGVSAYLWISPDEYEAHVAEDFAKDEERRRSGKS